MVRGQQEQHLGGHVKDRYVFPVLRLTIDLGHFLIHHSLSFRGASLPPTPVLETLTIPTPLHSFVDLMGQVFLFLSQSRVHVAFTQCGLREQETMVVTLAHAVTVYFTEELIDPRDIRGKCEGE